MLEAIWAWLLEVAAQRNAERCLHPAHEVVADVLEGRSDPTRAEYCRVCGSYRLVSNEITSGWRHPGRAYPRDAL